MQIQNLIIIKFLLKMFNFNCILSLYPQKILEIPHSNIIQLTKLDNFFDKDLEGKSSIIIELSSI